MDVDKKEVGQRIKSIRLSLGYTLEEFGSKMNPTASDSIVSRWEKGVSIPNNGRLVDIAFYGQISVDELLYGTDTNTRIMNDFIEWAENDMFIEADKEFELGENHFYSPSHIGAMDLAKRFINEKIGGTNNE